VAASTVGRSDRAVSVALESGWYRSVRTTHDTTRSWIRWAVDRWRFLIGPRGAFKLKFDRLN
jgi:hypothetical protein